MIRYLEDHPRKKYSFLYTNTESVNDENEFYRRVLNKLLKTEYIKKAQKVITFIEKHIPSIKKIGPDGFEFGVTEEHNYREILEKVLKSCSNKKEKLVILLDEFPQTLENIINNKDKKSGIKFLQSNRELRQDSDITETIQFIYTGSIGLENIVKRLNTSKTINDLAYLRVPPLTIEEARELIDCLLKNKKFTLSKNVVNYILSNIEWLIPFYIQLIIREIGNIYRDSKIKRVEKGTVNKAINQMLEHRNHFEHWEQRLRSSFSTNEYNFCKELLNITSEEGIISLNDIYNLAVKHNQKHVYKNLTDSLVYDGYINNNEDRKIYRFNSPILKKWWYQNVTS
ncbi:MAG: ATP-binding protein [Candidatus Aminicenantaceae bacterium]